ncbi:MAG: fibronectin type III domain-containing protein, partial [Acidimicrobiales bacterium]
TVEACISGGNCSNLSSPAGATINSTPNTPTGVQAFGEIGAARVAWAAPSANGSPITGYIVTPYKNGAAQAPRHFGTATSARLAGLVPGASYYFTVEAVNANGSSSPSNASNFVTPSKYHSTTVLTLSTARVTYGHEQVEHLSVSVRGFVGPAHGVVTISGTYCFIRLSVSGTGSCTLSANKFAVGSHTLRATFHSSPYYLASTSAPKALTVVK